MPPRFGGAPKCPVCQKSVYAAEEVKALGNSYHKNGCFVCCKCNTRLDSTRLNNHDDKLYCNTCYSKEFGPKGYGFAGGHAGLMQEENPAPTPVRAGAPEPFKAAPAEAKPAPVVSTPPPPAEVKAAPSKPAASRFGSSAPKCPTCGKSVYAAEEVKANGGSYHRGLCFVCKQCGKSLEQGKEKVHAGDIFCEPCHSAQFGPKGFRTNAGKMLTE